MAFDPDAYLASKENSFDPDAYLTSREKPISQKPKGFMSRAWNILGKPEQMSREGLGKIASMIPGAEPTGNKLHDIALNIPKVGAETLAEAAPGFVSRGSMLTAGAMPALKGLGKAAEVIGPGIARQAESLSGMKPGLLGKAFKDPSLMFASIPQEARDAYRSLNPALRASKMVSETPRPLALVNKALNVEVPKPGKPIVTLKLPSGKNFQVSSQPTIDKLKPEEAFAARKAIDQLWESRAITEDFKNMARETLDKVAKSKESIAKADTAFSRGMNAAGLRQLLPQNKYGGTSAFKTAIMAGLNGMGAPGKVAMAGLSPLAMGSGATALGAGAKAASPFVNNPRLASAVASLINALVRQSPPQSQGQ